METPWGQSDHEKYYTEDKGITFYSTPGHGGFFLTKDYNDKVHEALRQEPAWYEEDCEAAKIVYTFPELFKYSSYDPIPTIKGYFPDEWERMTGEKVTAEDSSIVADREFHAANEGKYIVICAYGDWHRNVPEGMVGVVATLNGARKQSEFREKLEMKYFLVPKDEYKSPFVIDESRHHVWMGDA
jgi:hypothetical protein